MKVDSNNLRLVLYFGLLFVVLVGGLAMLFDGTERNDNGAWGMLGLIVGLLVKEGSSILSASNVATIANAITPTTVQTPNANVSGGPVTVNEK